MDVKNVVKDQIKRVVVTPPGVVFKILYAGEEFTLQDKYYTNSNESIVLRSTHRTGQLIQPKKYEI